VTTDKGGGDSPQQRKTRRVPLAQRRRARRLVLQALYSWQLTDGEVSEIESQYRADNTGKVDWDYFHEVFSAIPGQAEELNLQFSPFLDRDSDALDPIEKALLYLGAFELMNRLDIPYRVVINECVELAKVFGATDSYKYINGVLDRLAKQLRSTEVAANTAR